MIVRPTGIYGASIDRLKRMAEHTQTYPNIHYSNRIHIDDLARFLAFLADFENPIKVILLLIMHLYLCMKSYCGFKVS